MGFDLSCSLGRVEHKTTLWFYETVTHPSIVLTQLIMLNFNIGESGISTILLLGGKNLPTYLLTYSNSHHLRTRVFNLLDQKLSCTNIKKKIHQAMAKVLKTKN